MIRTIQNFELFYKKPFQMFNILTYRFRHFKRGFCKWNNFRMLKYLIQTSIFRYSKKYGSLTHETRIKDAVNMGDLVCLWRPFVPLKLANAQRVAYIHVVYNQINIALLKKKNKKQKNKNYLITVLFNFKKMEQAMPTICNNMLIKMHVCWKRIIRYIAS